jgi:hypothetical protein
MTDDVLSSFVDAYRTEHSARSVDRRALRQRVVAAAGRRRVRRTERLRLLLSFAATFAGSVALAASPPLRDHVRDAFSFVRSGVPGRTDVGARSLPKRGTRLAVAPPAPLPPLVSAPTAALAPVAPAEVLSVAELPVAPPPVTLVSPRVARSRAEPSPRSVPVAIPPSNAGLPVGALGSVAPPATASLPNADLALYRRAHELHFGSADRTLALGAWDAYLKAFPRGTFAPEARLNRAVCLAKLGRKAEAEGVLVEIERGRFGTEGRRQARKILGALEED